MLSQHLAEAQLLDLPLLKHDTDDTACCHIFGTDLPLRKGTKQVLLGQAVHDAQLTATTMICME